MKTSTCFLKVFNGLALQLRDKLASPQTIADKWIESPAFEGKLQRMRLGVLASDLVAPVDIRPGDCDPQLPVSLEHIFGNVGPGCTRWQVSDDPLSLQHY